MFPLLHSRFDAPIAALDCGERCAPYNDDGVPFCCDTRHTIPSAYLAEWEYLQINTDLWHAYNPPDRPAGKHRGIPEAARLAELTPTGQVLIECQGHTRCQRDYRAITCRAFPFFPYLTREGQFIGLSYYWEYEDRCWVISHLQAVTALYVAQFIAAFDELFAIFPEEVESFRQQGIRMRRVFGRRGRALPLLHRNGYAYKITPRNGRLRRVDPSIFPLHGPYLVASRLPFPGED